MTQVLLVLMWMVVTISSIITIYKHASTSGMNLNKGERISITLILITTGIAFMHIVSSYYPYVVD